VERGGELPPLALARRERAPPPELGGIEPEQAAQPVGLALLRGGQRRHRAVRVVHRLAAEDHPGVVRLEPDAAAIG
jgi:hypothetical protein